MSELAKVFTGYHYDKRNETSYTRPSDGRVVSTTNFTKLPMYIPILDRYKQLPVTFVGTAIPAGTPADQALNIVIDKLFNHANVGPFFARTMIQRLVTSNPSPAYVSRGGCSIQQRRRGRTRRFESGVQAVLLDPEARLATSLTQTTFGKVREPMNRLVQWAWTFGATSANGEWRLRHTSDPAYALGQSPLRAPSVFNYFRPRYVPPATALTATKSPAPEHRFGQARPGCCRRADGDVLPGIPRPEIRPVMKFTQPNLHARRGFLRRSGQLALTGTALPMALNLAAMGEAAAFNATDYKALACVSWREETTTGTPSSTTTRRAKTATPPREPTAWRIPAPTWPQRC